MSKPVIKQTQYKGYLFRSRLEARWAVFFDACGVKYEYEPEGYILENGDSYLPDFLLHDVYGRAGGDLYVEVKGHMTDADARKIKSFAGIEENCIGKSETATLVLGDVPTGENMQEIIEEIGKRAYKAVKDYPHEFNFETIDGDYFALYPGINKDGKFELFGDDYNYLCDMDEDATLCAYRRARQARFEFGETPKVKEDR